MSHNDVCPCFLRGNQILPYPLNQAFVGLVCKENQHEPNKDAIEN